MSVILKLASSLNRNDEVPNQELAKELCLTKDTETIKELADCLFHGSTPLKNDSIKVLYEIGAAQPELIADYTRDFIKLLTSNNNRLVWGGMTALAAIAHLNPDQSFTEIELIMKVIQNGSVITIDNGISVLAKVSAAKPEYEKQILPFILEHLETCRPKEVPQHSERSLVMVNAGNKTAFLKVLEKRIPDLTPAQLKRVIKVLQGIKQL